MRDLEDPLGSRQVAQRVLTQVDQVDLAVLDQLLGRQGHHDLPTVRDRHQPRRSVHRSPVVVPVAHLGGTAVDAHSHPQRSRRPPFLPTERELRGDCRIDRATRTRANAAWNPSPVVFTT